MKISRFSDTQIITILKQAEGGIKVKGLCREHGSSDATYYNWKAKYGGLEASDLKRLKEVEGECPVCQPAPIHELFGIT